MAIREVLIWPNPFLKKKADQVELFNGELQTLIEDMRETMLAQDGIGLAATQIGENQRLFIIDRCAFEREREPGEIIALINPELVEESDEQIAELEGCLSFPEVYIKVKRPCWVKFRAQDPQGDYFEVEGEALGARALHHELDHLDGKVMTDRVPFPLRTRALKKHQRIQRGLRQRRARGLE